MRQVCAVNPGESTLSNLKATQRAPTLFDVNQNRAENTQNAVFQTLTPSYKNNNEITGSGAPRRLAPNAMASNMSPHPSLNKYMTLDPDAHQPQPF